MYSRLDFLNAKSLNWSINRTAFSLCWFGWSTSTIAHRSSDWPATTTVPYNQKAMDSRQRQQRPSWRPVEWPARTSAPCTPRTPTAEGTVKCTSPSTRTIPIEGMFFFFLALRIYIPIIVSYSNMHRNEWGLNTAIVSMTIRIELQKNEAILLISVQEFWSVF